MTQKQVPLPSLSADHRYPSVLIARRTFADQLVSRSEMNLDTFLQQYCPFGILQRRACMAMCFATLIASLQVSLLVFINLQPVWWCVGHSPKQPEAARCQALKEGTCQLVFKDREATVTAHVSFTPLCDEIGQESCVFHFHQKYIAVKNKDKK